MDRGKDLQAFPAFNVLILSSRLLPFSQIVFSGIVFSILFRGSLFAGIATNGKTENGYSFNLKAMKNLVISMFIVAGTGWLTTSFLTENKALAFVATVRDAVPADALKGERPNTLMLLPSDAGAYTGIAMTDVPRHIRSSVATKYAAYVLTEAYQGLDRSYKLVLRNGADKLTVYHNEDGEYMKEKTARTGQTFAYVYTEDNKGEFK